MLDEDGKSFASHSFSVGLGFVENEDMEKAMKLTPSTVQFAGESTTRYEMNSLDYFHKYHGKQAPSLE